MDELEDATSNSRTHRRAVARRRRQRNNDFAVALARGGNSSGGSAGAAAGSAASALDTPASRKANRRLWWPHAGPPGEFGGNTQRSALPGDVLLKVTDYLHVSDLGHLGATSKYFHTMTSNDVIWSQLFARHFQQDDNRLLRGPLLPWDRAYKKLYRQRLIRIKEHAQEVAHETARRRLRDCRQLKNSSVNSQSWLLFLVPLFMWSNLTVADVTLLAWLLRGLALVVSTLAALAVWPVTCFVGACIGLFSWYTGLALLDVAWFCHLALSVFRLATLSGQRLVEYELPHQLVEAVGLNTPQRTWISGGLLLLLRAAAAYAGLPWVSAMVVFFVLKSIWITIAWVPLALVLPSSSALAWAVGVLYVALAACAISTTGFWAIVLPELTWNLIQLILAALLIWFAGFLPIVICIDAIKRARRQPFRMSMLLEYFGPILGPVMTYGAQALIQLLVPTFAWFHWWMLSATGHILVVAAWLTTVGFIPVGIVAWYNDNHGVGAAALMALGGALVGLAGAYWAPGETLPIVRALIGV